MPSCLVIQHVAQEGPYGFGDALDAAGIAVALCRVFAGEALPEGLDAYDGLIVMGGPMSATSDDGFATRSAEVALLARALSDERPVLGICLGAQLLALAARGEVFAGTAGKEIGWGAITFSPESASDELLGGLGSSCDVLHWHGDTFTLPAGAVLLASSERYANQAFRAGRRAWGLQFHVEVDALAVDGFLSAFGYEAASAGISPASIAAEAPRALAALAPVREAVAQRFSGVVSSFAEARGR